MSLSAVLHAAPLPFAGAASASWAANCDEHEAAPISVLIEGVGALSGGSNTLCMSLSSTDLSVSSLQREVSSRLCVSDSAFHLLCQTQLLRVDHLVAASSSPSDPLVLRLVARAGLVGGKGGFGSLLRGATTKVGTKKTSNFSASRDLSGRRLRHVEAEQKIAEWNATEHEPVNQQGKREEIHTGTRQASTGSVRARCGRCRLGAYESLLMLSVLSPELNAKYKAIKAGRNYDVKPCKWGATCKYRYSTCHRDHPPDPNATEHHDGRITTMPAEIGVTPLPAPVSKRRMQDAVTAGLQSSRKRTRLAGEESKSGDEEEDEQYVSSDDDYSHHADEDEPSSKRFHHDYIPSAVPELPAAAAASSSSAAAAAASCYLDDDLPAASSPVTPASVFAKPYVAPTHSFPAVTHRAPELASVEPTKAAQGLAAVLAQVKQKQQKAPAAAPPAAVSSDAAATPSSSAPASFDTIDLSAVESVDALFEFGAPHLTAELTRVGLKAGGTQRQKAERLFLLKGTTIDKLPVKVRATTPA